MALVAGTGGGGGRPSLLGVLGQQLGGPPPLKAPPPPRLPPARLQPGDSRSAPQQVGLRNSGLPGGSFLAASKIALAQTAARKTANNPDHVLHLVQTGQLGVLPARHLLAAALTPQERAQRWIKLTGAVHSAERRALGEGPIDPTQDLYGYAQPEVSPVDPGSSFLANAILGYGKFALTPVKAIGDVAQHHYSQAGIETAGMLPFAVAPEAGLAAKAIAYSAPFLAQGGISVGQDVHRSINEGHPDFRNTLGYGSALGHQIGTSITDPGKNPFLTAITAYALASGSAGLLSRGAAARSALAEGAGVRGALFRPGTDAGAPETFGNAGGSLLHRPGPQPRVLEHNGFSAYDRDLSANSLARGGERLRDLIQKRFPNLGVRTPQATPLIGQKTLVRDYVSRVGHANAENLRYSTAIEAAGANQLAREAHSRNMLGLPEYDTPAKAAVGIALEGAPLDQRIAALRYFREEAKRQGDAEAGIRAQLKVAEASGGVRKVKALQESLGRSLRAQLAVRRLDNQISIHEAAGRYLTHDAVAGATGSRLAPRIADEYPKLQRLTELARQVSEKSTATAQRLGLPSEFAQARVNKPALEYEAAAAGRETPLAEHARLSNDQNELSRLMDSSVGKRVRSLQTILQRVTRTMEKRGTPEHGPAVDELRAALAEHVHHHGQLVDVLGTKGAQDALEHGVGVGPTGGLARGAGPEIPPNLDPALERTLFGGRTFESSPGSTTPAAPLSEAEARSRVERTNQAYNELVDKAAEQAGHPYLRPEEYAKEQLRRNKVNGIIGKSEHNAAQRLDEPKTKAYRVGGQTRALHEGRLPTVKSEIRAHGEAYIEKMLRERLHEPAVAGWAARLEEAARLERGLHHIDEIRKLGTAVHADEFASAFGAAEHQLGREPTQEELLHHLGPVGPDLITPAVTTEIKTHPDLATTLPAARAQLAKLEGERNAGRGESAQISLLKTEIDRALSTQRGTRMSDLLRGEEDRLARLEELHHQAVSADIGVAHVPQRMNTSARVSQSFRVGTGQHENIGIPLTPRQLKQRLSGVLIRSGGNDLRAPETIAAHALELERHGARLQLLDKLKETDAEGRYLHLRDTPDEIAASGGRPVRVRVDAARTITPELRSAYEKQAAGLPLSRTEQESLAFDEHHHVEHVFPTAKELSNETNASGIKYADERLLGGLNKRTPPNVLISAADAVNKLQRFALLHSNPGYYSTIGASNYLMALEHEGLKFVPNFVRMLRLSRGERLSPAALAKARAAAGGGYGASTLPRGLASTAVKGIEAKFASAANRTIELPPRMTAFLHEAARSGVKSPADLERLLEDPAHHQMLVRVSRRASQSVIDFGRLGPHEASLIRHLWFFYPWAKGATIYTGWLAREHPMLAAALANGGNLAYQHAVSTLGPLPDSAFGVYPTGQHENVGGANLPEVLKLGAINVPQTILDNVRALTGQGGESLGTVITPAFQALAAGLLHYNLSKGRAYQPTGAGAVNYLKGSVSDTYHSQVDTLPLMLLKSRLAAAGNARAQAAKVLPLSKGDAFEQYFLRGPASRPYNPVAGQAQIAHDEYANAAPGKGKVDVEMKQLTQKLEAKLTPQARAVLGPALQRFQAYREAIATAPKIAGKLQPQDELTATLKFLASQGALHADVATKIDAAIAKIVNPLAQTAAAKEALVQLRAAFKDFYMPPALQQVASAYKVKLPAK